MSILYDTIIKVFYKKSIIGGEFMNLLAYFATLVKSVIYGSTVFFTGKLTETVNILDILALRFLLSFTVIWLLKVTRIFKIRVGLKDFLVKNERSDYIKPLILTAIFEPVLYMFFETLGISMTNGITSGVILSLAPISSCICQSVFLKEKTSTAVKVFLGIGIVGVLYIAVNTNSSEGQNSLPGILFLVLSVVCGSLFAVFSRKSSKAFSPLEITYIYCLLGAVAFNTVNVVRHIINGSLLTYFVPYFDVQNMIGFVFLGVISAIFATVINSFALSKLKPSTMSAFGGISTFVTVIIGVAFNNEKLYFYHTIGFILIIIRMIGVSAIEIYNDRKKSLDN